MESLAGRYYTACDVGTYSEDMDHIARECSTVTGRTVAHGGAGDSSVLTAYGVFQRPPRRRRAHLGHCRRRGVLEGRGSASPASARSGATSCGTCSRPAPGSSSPTSSPPALERVREEHPEVEVAASTEALVAGELDVYAPCALGHALTDEVVEVLSARIVCGAANNQLAHPGVEKALLERGIVYAPDYCVNAGGLIQVADELEGFSFERAQQRASHIYDTTRAVLELAASDGGLAGHRRRPTRREAHARGRSTARHLAALSPPPSGRRGARGAGLPGQPGKPDLVDQNSGPQGQVLGRPAPIEALTQRPSGTVGGSGRLSSPAGRGRPTRVVRRATRSAR